MKGINRFILCTLMGWKIQGRGPDDIKKFVIIVGPHTSNWDFVIGALARPFINLPEAKFVAKAELFKPPFGWFFRMMGGYPVDRTKSNNLVDAIVQIYDEKEVFYITITPEGTRKYTGKLRSGFYHIARGANVPVIIAGFDYPTKTVIIKEPFYLSDDMESDMAKIMEEFSKIRGKNPEDGLP